MLPLILVFSLVNILFGLACIYVCHCYREQAQEVEARLNGSRHAAEVLERIGEKYNLQIDNNCKFWIASACDLKEAREIEVEANTLVEVVEKLRIATGTKFAGTESWTCNDDK